MNAPLRRSPRAPRPVRAAKGDFSRAAPPPRMDLEASTPASVDLPMQIVPGPSSAFSLPELTSSEDEIGSVDSVIPSREKGKMIKTLSRLFHKWGQRALLAFKYTNLRQKCKRLLIFFFDIQTFIFQCYTFSHCTYRNKVSHGGWLNWVSLRFFVMSC